MTIIVIFEDRLRTVGRAMDFVEANNRFRDDRYRLTADRCVLAAAHFLGSLQIPSVVAVSRSRAHISGICNEARQAAKASSGIC
jgi:hypothetical protein